MSPGGGRRRRLGLADSVEQGRSHESHFVDQRWAVCCDGLDRDAVEDVEEVARDRLAILLHAGLVERAMHGEQKLVPVLLDDEAHELLARARNVSDRCLPETAGMPTCVT
jgi:hypothetical protein